MPGGARPSRPPARESLATIPVPTGFRPVAAAESPAGETGRDLWVLLAIVGLGAALRAWRLGAELLWNDEGFSWWWSQQPLADLWGAQGRIETNPPLYYTLQHLWLVFGNSEAALRSISAILGTLTVPLAYLIGRAVVGRGAGLLAAALLATSAVHVHYSQEARGYALLGVAAAAAVLGLLTFLRAHDGPHAPPGAGLGGLALYVLGTTVALYTHHTAVFLLALANLAALGWWLGRADASRRFLLAWLAANLVPVAAWLWLLPAILAQAKAASTIGWIVQPRLHRALYDVLRLYGGRYVGRGPPAAILLAPLPLLALLGLRSLRRPVALVLATFLAGVPLLTYAAGLAGRPLWIERTLLWPLPLGLALAAAGIVTVPRPRLRAAVLALILGAQAVDLAAYYTKTKKTPFAAAAAAITRSWRPGDALLLVPGEISFPLAYYLRRDGPRVELLGLDPRVPGLPPYGAYQAYPIGPPVVAAPLRQITLQTLGELPGRYGRLWVLSRRSDEVDPGGRVMADLARIGTVAERRSFRPYLELSRVVLARPAGDGPTLGTDADHPAPTAGTASPQPRLP